MRKNMLLLFLCALLASSASAQLAVVKLIGKNASKSKLGFGVFAYYDLPLNEEGNQSLRLELLDFAYMPAKDKEVDPVKGYLSIKLGYKYIFSETRTGFYLEPQAGYCRVISVPPHKDATYGDGIAIALETGYGVEVGQQNNLLNFGLKYENDRAGKEHTISSIGFRASYSFNLFRRRDN